MKRAFFLILMIICLAPLQSFGDDCIEGDCVNGKGTMVYATGHQFTGGFKDGGRHGEGVLLMQSKKSLTPRGILLAPNKGLVSLGLQTMPLTSARSHRRISVATWSLRERPVCSFLPATPISSVSAASMFM